MTVTVPLAMRTCTGRSSQRALSVLRSSPPVKRSAAEKYSAIWLGSVMLVAALTVNVSSIPSPSVSLYATEAAVLIAATASTPTARTWPSFRVRSSQRPSLPIAPRLSRLSARSGHGCTSTT